MVLLGMGGGGGEVGSAGTCDGRRLRAGTRDLLLEQGEGVCSGDDDDGDLCTLYRPVGVANGEQRKGLGEREAADFSKDKRIVTRKRIQRDFTLPTSASISIQRRPADCAHNMPPASAHLNV